MQKIRVGVLMGGKSIEREVSFNSGRTVCDHLDTTRYIVIPIFQTHTGSLFILPWHFLHRGKISDFIQRLSTEAKSINWDMLKDIIDFMYICTHGQFAEDGTLQGTLELLQIPYLGSKVYASALCMDKAIQKTVMRMHNITIAKDITLTPYDINTLSMEDIIKKLEQQQITFPCVVKPHKEGSSLGVFIAHNAKELADKIYKASWINTQKQQTVLIEEKINGLEFSCITITDYKNNQHIALPPTEIVPEQETEIFDYEQKYMPGRAHKFTPARAKDDIIKKIQDTCIAVTKALNIHNISRIDGFVTKDEKIYIIDPNTLSGMSPSSFLFREAAEIGMTHTDLINHLIETELHYYGMLDQLISQEKNMKQSTEPKIRVAVLFGGRSHEKEISLESGRNIIYKLSPQKYISIPLFVNKNLELYQISPSILVRNSTEEIECLLTKQMHIPWSNLSTLADFVFIALHGGEGEDGTVQGMLEMLNMPYNGSSVLTSALCMNKYTTNQLLHAQGFDTPKGYLIDTKYWLNDKKAHLENIMSLLPFPVIIKPHNDGCSVMVYKAKNELELSNAIDHIQAQGKSQVLIEEFITGMELTVGILGNDNPLVFPPSQAISTHEILSIQEKFLPGAGENQTPAPLDKKAMTLVQETIKKIYISLGCKGYARIDCFYQSASHSKTKKERVIIIEINTLPGMTPATCIFHQAAEINIKPMELIDRIIKLGIEEHTALIQKNCINTEITI